MASTLLWRTLAFGVLLSAGGLTACRSDQTTASAEGQPDEIYDGPPNLVLIVCDDLGYGDLGAYGHPTIKTPVLDKLAASGLKLTSCYAGAPVCSPARAAIMTGKIPQRVGINDWIDEDTGIYLHEEEMTMPELLQTAGYRTGLVGKWHLNSRADGTEPTPTAHGFDHAFYTQNNAAPSHENPTNFIRNGEEVGPLEGHATTLVTDEAIDFITAEQDQPFALCVMFHAPHEPIATPAAYQNLYPGYADTATQPAYYGSVSLIDQEVGRLLNTLDSLSLTDKTLLVFTSDNGPETLRRYPKANHSHGSAQPLQGMKLHITEGGYRVPGIVHWPGHTIQSSSDEPVSGIDILPTFCEAAGVKLPHEINIDGTSLLPLFQEDSLERTHPLYWQYDKALNHPFTLALRDGHWKMIADSTLTESRLYNLINDVGETDDLSSEHPSRVASMKDSLREMYAEINHKEEPPL